MQKQSSSNELISKMSLYLQCISAQDTLLQSYRMLFIGTETILFALAFSFLQRPQKDFIVLSVFGFSVCVFWIIVTNLRGRIIDKLKKKTKILAEESGLLDLFKLAYGSKGEKFLPRLTFNIILPLSAIGLWVLIILQKVNQ